MAFRFSLLALYFICGVCWAQYPALAERSFTKVGKGWLNKGVFSRALEQDKYGFIWIGGSNGLWRYDGYKLRHYPHIPGDLNSPMDNDIYSVVADEKGGLWINSGHFVSYFETQTESFKHYSADAQNPLLPLTTELNKISIDDKGGVWFAGFGGVSYLPSGESSFEKYGAESSLSESHNGFNAWTVLPVDGGGVYLGTMQGLGYKGPNDTDFAYIYTNGVVNLKGVSIIRIAQDSKGRLWLGTQGQGIYWIDETGQLHHQSRRDGLYGHLYESRQWEVIAVDDEIWFLCSRNGLFIVDADSGEISMHHSTAGDSPFGIALPDLRVGLKLQSGQVLISGESVERSGASLQMFSPQKDFTRWISRKMLGWKGTQDGLASIEINGDILFFGDEVTRFNLDVGRVPHGIPVLDEIQASIGNQQILHAVWDSKGRIWLGTSASELWVVNIAENSLKKFDVGSLRCEFDDVFYLRDGQLIYECREGGSMALIDTRLEKVSQFFYRHEAKSVGFGGFLELDDGALLFGSSVGLMYLPAKFRSVSGSRFEVVALNDVRISDLFDGSEGDIWIDSDQGLYRLKKGLLWQDIELAVPGRSRRFINFAYPDGVGRVWGAEGLFDVGKEKFVSLDDNDGYYFKLATAAPLRVSKDIWMQPTPEGLQLINPSEFSDWNYAVPVQISELKLDGKRQKGTFFDEVIIEPSIRKLSIEVAALDYESGTHRRYDYILEGYNDHWQEGGEENRRIVFENLPPGQYQLKIRASNYRGIMSDRMLSLKVVVKPAWHQSLWFKVVLIIMLLIMFHFFVRYREGQLRSKKQELENTVKERTRELAGKNDTLKVTLHELNDTVEELRATQDSLIEQEKVVALGKMVKGLAHEINTPLGVAVTAATDVMDRTSRLEKDFNSGCLSAEGLQRAIESLNSSSNMVFQNLSRTNNLVKSFKELGLEEEAGLSQEVLVRKFLCQLCLNTFANTDVDWDVLGSDELKVSVSKSDLISIVNQLLKNSVLHAQIPGKDLVIRISHSFEKGELVIVYNDNGPGISAKVAREIFEPFFTTLRANGGVGLGLSMVYNLVVHKLGGNILVNPEVKQGAEFVVRIPAQEVNVK